MALIKPQIFFASVFGLGYNIVLYSVTSRRRQGVIFTDLEFFAGRGDRFSCI